MKIFILKNYLSIIFLVALFKSVFFSFFGLNFYDYGETLQNATRLLQGQGLYKDIWAFFPPADNYFPALILKIFGNSLLSVRLVESILFALFVLVLILIAKNLLAKNLLILFALLVIFSDLNTYLLFYNLFFYAAILLFISYTKSKSRRWLFYSGLSLGVGALFRHDAFLTTVAAISLTLLLLTWRSMEFNRFYGSLVNYFFFFCGSVLIILPILFWLKIQGVLGEFFYLGFIKAPQISKILSSGTQVMEIFSWPPSLGNLFSVFTLSTYLVYIALIFGALFVTTKFFIHKENLTQKHYVFLCLLFLGLLQIPYAFSVVEMGHLIKAGIPIFVIGLYLLSNLLNFKNSFKKLVIYSPFFYFIVLNIIISIWWVKYNDTLVHFKHGSVFINSSYESGSTHPTAKTLTKSLKFVEDNTKSNEYIFAAPYHALFYFLADRNSPSRFNNFAAGFVSENEQEGVIAEIENKQVNVVIYDPNIAPLEKAFKDYSPKIHSYIMSSYDVLDVTEQGWLLMRRKNE